jgi:hypothetical protein
MSDSRLVPTVCPQVRQITTNFLDHVDTNRPYKHCDLPRLRLAIRGSVMTENREVTGSTSRLRHCPVSRLLLGAGLLFAVFRAG